MGLSNKLKTLSLFLVQMQRFIAAQELGMSLIPYLEAEQERGNEQKNRPVINTFTKKEISQTIFETHEGIRIWAEAWYDAGWDPKIISEKDAKKNPKYETYKKYFDEQNKFPRYHQWSQFIKFIVMSQNEYGGWYASQNVLPIRADLFNYAISNLPNDGKFTIHDERMLSELLSGSQEEWDKLCQLTMNDAHNNDARLLKNLLNDNPDEFILVNSVLDSKDLQDASKKYELCSILTDKLAARYSYGYDGKYSRREYYEIAKFELNELKKNCRNPTIHAFCEDTPTKICEVESAEWKKRWESSGWKTIILSLDDAEEHEAFDQFQDTFDYANNPDHDEETKMTFYAWLAMSATGTGGLLSLNFENYPLSAKSKAKSSNKQQQRNLLPCFLSGSKQQWDAATKLLLLNIQNHTDLYWNDILALEEISDENNFDALLPNEVPCSTFVYNDETVSLSTQ